MKLRNMVTGFLLLFVLGSLAFLLSQEFAPSAVPGSQLTGAGAGPKQVVAYYFHGRARCITCRHLEAYAGEALQAGFPQELADGRLAWRTVDTSLPENRHFVADYQIRFQSLILVEVKDGQQQRWRNLDEIWQKVRDKESYVAYVQEETRAFLAGGL